MFSPELADLTLYIIDVSEGDQIPRKGSPGITRSDLAPMVGASLEVMERDSKKMRGDRPFVFAKMLKRKGMDEIEHFIIDRGMLPRRG